MVSTTPKAKDSPCRSMQRERREPTCQEHRCVSPKTEKPKFDCWARHVCRLSWATQVLCWAHFDVLVSGSEFGTQVTSSCR